MHLQLVGVSQWKKTMYMHCKPSQLSIIEICPDRPVELERWTLLLYMWVEWWRARVFFGFVHEKRVTWAVWSSVRNVSFFLCLFETINKSLPIFPAQPLTVGSLIRLHAFLLLTLWQSACFKRPGASFINVVYTQKNAYAILFAHHGIYEKRT